MIYMGDWTTFSHSFGIRFLDVSKFIFPHSIPWWDKRSPPWDKPSYGQYSWLITIKNGASHPMIMPQSTERPHGFTLLFWFEWIDVNWMTAVMMSNRNLRLRQSALNHTFLCEVPRPTFRLSVWRVSRTMQGPQFFLLGFLDHYPNISQLETRKWFITMARFLSWASWVYLSIYLSIYLYIYIYTYVYYIHHMRRVSFIYREIQSEIHICILHIYLLDNQRNREFMNIHLVW